MTEGLAEVLFDLLAARRRQALPRGGPEIPEWVFCSDAGTAFDERNFSREWYRLRRRAEKHGIRSLKLHATRHTWATLALQAGKSLRWVADQLGHADPGFTLRVHTHAMREDESRNSPTSLVGRQGLETRRAPELGRDPSPGGQCW
jgi:integrase